MQILMSDDEVIREINDYPAHNWIWIEIWEMSEYEIQVVVTVNKEEMCHLGEHKTIHACSAQTDVTGDVCELKTYGKSLVKHIRSSFHASAVHSKLYYR